MRRNFLTSIGPLDLFRSDALGETGSGNGGLADLTTSRTTGTGSQATGGAPMQTNLVTFAVVAVGFWLLSRL